MIEKNYTAEDSREVRKIYYEAVRKQKAAGIRDERKMLITKDEWQKFSKQGRDMSKYEIWQEFRARTRKEECLRRKEEYLKTRGVEQKEK